MLVKTRNGTIIHSSSATQSKTQVKQNKYVFNFSGLYDLQNTMFSNSELIPPTVVQFTLWLSGIHKLLREMSIIIWDWNSLLAYVSWARGKCFPFTLASQARKTRRWILLLLWSGNNCSKSQTWLEMMSVWRFRDKVFCILIRQNDFPFVKLMLSIEFYVCASLLKLLVG